MKYVHHITAKRQGVRTLERAAFKKPLFVIRLRICQLAWVLDEHIQVKVHIRFTVCSLFQMHTEKHNALLKFKQGIT